MYPFLFKKKDVVPNMRKQKISSLHLYPPMKRNTYPILLRRIVSSGPIVPFTVRVHESYANLRKTFLANNNVNNIERCNHCLFDCKIYEVKNHILFQELFQRTTFIFIKILVQCHCQTPLHGLQMQAIKKKVTRQATFKAQITEFALQGFVR